MSSSKLPARLLFYQFVASVVADVLVATFAPRLLLLGGLQLRENLIAASWCWSLMIAVEFAVGLHRVRASYRTLALIDRDHEMLQPEELLALYRLPAQLAAEHIAIVVAIAAATLFNLFRPPGNDLPTQVALFLFMVTIAGATTLLLYVQSRALVVSSLERVPPIKMYEVLAVRPIHVRVRKRLLVAVVAPVAFVALGASLLVDARVRAFEAALRMRNAAALAHVATELPNGHSEGRSETIERIRRLRMSAEVGTTPLDVTIPTLFYLLLAMTATAMAAWLGWIIGIRFSRDVVTATNEAKRTGIVEVLMGLSPRANTRFTSLSALMQAIGDLGVVFSEFALVQRRAVLARETSERMRGVFLATMSHDLKAPLNAILGFAELVKRNDLSEGQRESIGIVEQRGRELLSLILTILDSARARAGELEVSPEWTDIGEVVMSAVLEARKVVHKGHVQIVGEVQPDLPVALIDPTRVVQALTAVIGSAVRFTEQGNVHVRATLPSGGHRVRIVIETSGRGVTGVDREKLFEAFKYPDRARRHGSLGLGLSLARSILQLHTGSIDVEMMTGGNMAFNLWLPVARGSGASIRS